MNLNRHPSSMATFVLDSVRKTVRNEIFDVATENELRGCKNKKNYNLLLDKKKTTC